MSEPFLFGVEEDEVLQAGTAPYGSDEEDEEEDEWEASCSETEEAEEEREAGRSLSEQTVLTEVQEEDEAPRSPDDIILPTIPLRDETEEGRLVAAERRMKRQFSSSITVKGWTVLHHRNKPGQ